MDYNYLRGKIVEKGYNQKEFSKQIGISSQNLSDKINGKIDFKQKEIQKISTILLLTPEEITRIFFN